MSNGYCVIQWMRQNGYTITSMAEEVNYSRSMLSRSLNHNRISVRLSDLLYNKFGILVIATVDLPKESQIINKQSIKKKAKGPARGRWTPGSSKLDRHATEIIKLITEGETQKNIAAMYNTTPSNLHAWIESRGVKRSSEGNIESRHRDKESL